MTSHDNRVSSETDVFRQAVGYGYDANSNRTQLGLGGATNASYQYDVINRLTQLTDSASLAFNFAYDATNKLTSRTTPNGTTATHQYDALDRLTRLTHTKAPTTIADFQYQFNAASNISQLTDGAGAHNYSYDSVDRLTAATHPNQTNESYTYEAVGNRTASHQGSSYTYQPFNRLLTANSSSFSYDANGNLTTKTDATGTWTYTWDYENRLKQASLSGGVSVTYAYDALGRRIQRSGTSATTKFVYDGADVIRDLNADLTVVTDYLNVPGIDNKLRQTSGGTTLYFIQDQLGSTRSLADASGNVTASLGYDSFGKVVSGSASTRYTYTGREADAETGLIYYRARWYDPQQGRFISEDPVGFSGGINLYGYVRNNPLNFVDPNGESPLAAIVVIGGVVVAEALLHRYFARRAERFFPNEPFGRQKHCYVNCMSMRIHLGQRAWPAIFSIGQEIPPLMQGVLGGDSSGQVAESLGDLRADIYGQQSAFIIWKSCKELCTGCP